MSSNWLQIYLFVSHFTEPVPKIIGRGGHGALPHQTIDSILVAAQVVNTIHSIVSRNISPLESAVISIGEFHAGSATNIIPDSARISGTVRFFNPEVGAKLLFRLEEAIAPVKSLLDGKIVVDCTNPVGANLSHGLQSQISGSETIQEFVPNAHVVKAFTIYGYENFEDSTYAGYGDLKPAMLIAGNNPSAKETVSSLCSQLGWESVDTGNLSMSLHLEHMTLLWIKMARVQGKGSGFVWAMLQR